MLMHWIVSKTTVKRFVKSGRNGVLSLALGLLLPLGYAVAGPTASNVIVLANESQADSVALARYYMEKRGIPEENLVALPMPTKETITWPVFVESVFNPLRTELVQRDRIRAVLTGTGRKDRLGRVPGSFFGHDIDFLVVVKGVPLRVAESSELLEAEPVGADLRTEFRTNRGALDAELALLAVDETPAIAFVPNPYFQQRPAPLQARRAIIRVARLDGPDFASARALVDRALEAETLGLRGRAYIDRGGPHPRGNEWLTENEALISKLGYSLTVDDAGPLLEETQRFDAPALYFGWWRPHPEGAVGLEDVRFPPGAVGIHIHSFSANTIRVKKSRWVGPLVDKGITATVGNVWEPYLELTHQTSLFLEALAEGDTVGEAAFYALRVLSWQAILIGDPLYRPFAVSLEEQMERIESGGIEPLDDYVIIRKMNLLVQEDRDSEALALGARYFARLPTPALGMRVAQLEFKGGDYAKALDVVESLARRKTFPASEAAVGVELADLVARRGGSRGQEIAFELWRTLLNESALTEKQLREWLPRGASVASRVDADAVGRQWDERYGRLMAAEEQRKAEEAKARANTKK